MTHRETWSDPRIRSLWNDPCIKPIATEINGMLAVVIGEVLGQNEVKELAARILLVLGEEHRHDSS